MAVAFNVSGAQPDIPRLNWEPRSDWINVRKDVSPAAVGDGRADDTAAIQAALDRRAVGKTVYLPPGTYRITEALVLRGPAPGSSVVGHGKDTRLVWDGEVGGRMFWSDGVAYSRYVGLSWDGQGKAAVGFDHASTKRFETEVRHEYESFRNFTGFGIRVGHAQKVASAEILYRNCLFENCGVAIGLLAFNDYNNTIDRCEFRDCGMGVMASKSNFYARNCHFERTRGTDFVADGEHGCSIRRCTSVGSGRFVTQRGTIAPLTVQDCRVADWKDEAAVYLNGSPVLMFDCVFEGSGTNRAPVRAATASQKLLLSNNRPAQPDRLMRGVAPENLYIIPAGRFDGVVKSAEERFLGGTVLLPGKVFDAVRDFGAKGDGRADDAAAIQATIDAARQHGRRALAYLPTGRYVVSKTISVTGSNYTVAGSGFRCGLVWRGEPGRPMVELSGAENVTLANIAVGHHDFGPMKHGADVLVTSPQGNATRVVLDEVYAFGMYQKMPDEHGIHFRDLPPGSIVDARHVQGNLRITGCGDAQLLFRTSYEGTVTVEGDVGSGDGFLGFLTRLATVSEPALRVRDNRSVAMSDFYIEQCQQAVVLSGGDGQSAGRVTLQLPKIHTETVKPLFDVGDYAGRIWCGQSQFYCEPERTTFVSRGTNAAQLILAGNFWYKSRPQFDLAEGCRRVLAGNAGAPDTPDHAEELAWIAAALDDLRRLGKVDTELSQRIAPSVMR